MRIVRVCLFFSPRTTAIILGVTGILLTVSVNYLTTYYLWIGIPAVGSLAYQHHEPYSLSAKQTNNSLPDVHILYSNLGCGRREAKKLHHSQRRNISHDRLTDSDLEELMTPWQLWSVDQCASFLPWYKVWWKFYMVLHVLSCSLLIFGAYIYKRKLLLPWIAMEASALVGHIFLGAIVLVYFNSPQAYNFAARVTPEHKLKNSTTDRATESTGHIETFNSGVVMDWAIYLTHVPWRLFWIISVASLYQELYLVNDGDYWKKTNSIVTKMGGSDKNK